MDSFMGGSLKLKGLDLGAAKRDKYAKKKSKKEKKHKKEKKDSKYESSKAEKGADQSDIVGKKWVSMFRMDQIPQ